MRTHNNLLGVVEGCDGLKTGYIRAAGFSIVATAERDGRRIVAVVIGSRSKTTRDAKAKELIAQAFLNLPPIEAAPPVTVLAEEAEEPALESSAARKKGVISRGTWVRGILVAAAVLVLLGVSRRAMKKKFDKYEFY
jgi:D-alanyl-D-alanine carboxypeptidase (penicillin-binding protein 5/6)